MNSPPIAAKSLEYATAFRFVLDRGYRPIWIEDGFFGGAE